MYNVLSLVLGLAAWALGLSAALKRNGLKRACLSLTLCSLAVLSQLLEVKRLVLISDWSALLDTIDAVVLAAFVLTVVTGVLNGIAVVRGKQ